MPFAVKSQSDQVNGAGGKDMGISRFSSVKKGSFFITPFYQIMHFEKLKLASWTNHYDDMNGQSSYDFTSDDIDEYNSHFRTEFNSSMTGIRIGYQLWNSLGVSGYAGINNYTFKSWIGNGNTETVSTNFPAFTLGLAFDYERKLNQKLAAIGLLSLNRCMTSTVLTRNNSGLELESSNLRSVYWEANLALAYTSGKLIPYIGAGFSQQFIHPVSVELTPTTTESGMPVIDKTKFDSHFTGSSAYLFAGAEYRFSSLMSMYFRIGLPNPARVTTGLRITI